ncbi:SIR2 family protein [Methanobrevibacter arboriphilus]|uniref:SIR2 family NAD-dependent protein deacylase n=1 Tax=Methanobrevibacter arboriphilus TaxID=39441 RepID=UPI0005B25DBF
MLKIISDESNLPICANDEKTTLIKMHGDFNHPNSMVITEEDYDSFINDNPMLSTYITNLLITRTPIFIGYSVDDYNLRMIWQVVKNRLGKLHRPAYAIKVNANTSEISKYHRRGVQVINLPGKTKDYSNILRELFEELKEYWNEKTLKLSKATEEDTDIQLKKPKSVQTNLCYLSSSIDNMLLYKKYFYPNLKKHEINIITMDDVINPGDNINAKVLAIINKADYFIIELNSKFSIYELTNILKKKNLNKRHLFVIGNRDNHFDEYHVDYDLNGKDPVELIEDISEQINIWAERINYDKGQLFKDETEIEKLFGLKEYNAAFISAFSDLEFKLREYIVKNLKDKDVKSKTNYYSLKNLLQIAINEKLLDPKYKKDILKLIKMRNLAVHENKKVNKKGAELIIDINKEITNSLKHNN